MTSIDGKHCQSDDRKCENYERHPEKQVAALKRSRAHEEINRRKPKPENRCDHTDGTTGLLDRVCVENDYRDVGAYIDERHAGVRAAATPSANPMGSSARSA